MPLKVISGDWDHIFPARQSRRNRRHHRRSHRHAADNGAKVIDLSLGGPGQSPVLRDAIEYAITVSAFVAIAAGNSGDDGNPLEYPAAYGRTIRARSR